MLSQNLLSFLRDKRISFNPSGENSEGDRLDDEFMKDMSEIEKKYGHLGKHEKIRVELWAKKLGEITKNLTWKQTRNLYSDLLLSMVLKGRITDPFDKVPPEGPLPNLSRIHLKSGRSTGRSSRSVLDDISNCSYLDKSYQNMHSAKKQNSSARPVPKANSKSVSNVEALMRQGLQGQKYERKISSSLSSSKKYLKVNELLQIEPNSIADLLSPIVSNKDSFAKDSFNKEEFYVRNFFGSRPDSNQIFEQPAEDPSSSRRNSFEEMKQLLEESKMREEMLKLELNQRDKRLNEFEAFFEKFTSELSDLRSQYRGSLSVIRAAMKFFLSNHEMFLENEEFEILLGEMMGLLQDNPIPLEQQKTNSSALGLCSFSRQGGRTGASKKDYLHASNRYSSDLEQKISRSHQITHEFLAFLENFEQRTERLKLETDLLSNSLINGNRKN